MKRIPSLLLALLIVLTSFGCGAKAYTWKAPEGAVEQDGVQTRAGGTQVVLDDGLK
jgi:hypothetical protein